MFLFTFCLITKIVLKRFYISSMKIGRKIWFKLQCIIVLLSYEILQKKLKNVAKGGTTFTLSINKKVDMNLLHHLPLLESSQDIHSCEMYSWFFRMNIIFFLTVKYPGVYVKLFHFLTVGRAKIFLCHLSYDYLVDYLKILVENIFFQLKMMN